MLLTRSANQGGVQLHRLKQLVSLGRHDEIVFVQTTNLMRPPIEGDSAPFGDEQRMVVPFFRGSANLIGEFQKLDKVLNVFTLSSRFTPSTFLTGHSGRWSSRSSISAFVRAGSPPRQDGSYKAPVHFTASTNNGISCTLDRWIRKTFRPASINAS